MTDKSTAGAPAAAAASGPEPIKVTDRPLAGAGNGVYRITVKIDDRQPGSAVVRTIQPKFAYQTE
jgi:hypothetical protein